MPCRMHSLAKRGRTAAKKLEPHKKWPKKSREAGVSMEDRLCACAAEPEDFLRDHEPEQGLESGGIHSC